MKLSTDIVATCTLQIHLLGQRALLGIPPRFQTRQVLREVGSQARIIHLLEIARHIRTDFRQTRNICISLTLDLGDHVVYLKDRALIPRARADREQRGDSFLGIADFGNDFQRFKKSIHLEEEQRFVTVVRTLLKVVPGLSFISRLQAHLDKWLVANWTLLFAERAKKIPAIRGSQRTKLRHQEQPKHTKNKSEGEGEARGGATLSHHQRLFGTLNSSRICLAFLRAPRRRHRDNVEDSDEPTNEPPRDISSSR